jgi:hypothetical protein
LVVRAASAYNNDLAIRRVICPSRLGKNSERFGG